MNELQIQVRKLIQEKNPALYKKLPGFVLRYLERVVHEKEINAFLKQNGHLKNQAFCEAVIEYLQLNVVFHGLERIPSVGPVIMVLNHPLGGVDGVAFIYALRNHRPDLVFIVNDILLNLTPLEDLFIGVNKHGTNRSETRGRITEIFHSDKAVSIFPAGLVSRKQKGIVKDLEWKRTFVQYARKTGHPIVPIHIEGELSRFFYGLHRSRSWLGIKSTVEMLYLADEMYKQKGKSIVFKVGEPIYIQKNNPKSDHDLAQEIKETLYQIPQHNGSHHR